MHRGQGVFFLISSYSCSFNFRVKDFEGKLEFLTHTFSAEKQTAYFHVILLCKSLYYCTPDLPCGIFNLVENMKICFISTTSKITKEKITVFSIFLPFMKEEINESNKL